MAFRRFWNPRQINQLCNYSKKTSPPGGASKINVPTETFSREGDNGMSKTLTGEKLPKNHNVFKAIGATEELLSSIGVAREHATESEQEYTDKLKRIQTIIIDISTAISRSGDKTKKPIPDVYTKELEDWIREYSKQLPPPEQYIIPGGGVASASLHFARAICRKTERAIWPFVQEGTVDKEAQIYLNRLSDFLFTVSRIAAKHDKRAESIYIPKPDEKIQEQIMSVEQN
ncbi:corrinoid adenosyltransferase MMAB-like [Aethina tumida]|uniref:corrinoid adenosyltransferase MMAB-like n=1 Tax=Aethina tumida TaxID=116153 RepID=UPI00096B5924|nr:corrinoid adenosyltransferase MMAB-like [Aethina tumida]